MALSAVFLLLAIVAHRSEAGCVPNEVCAAYFIYVGMDFSIFPAGKVWQGKACCPYDPAKYIVCKFFNGVFSGDMRRCPAGQLFNFGAKQAWGQTCLPAKDYQRKECPNWAQYVKPQPVPIPTKLDPINTAGTHGCIDCVIGKCHHCLCQEALKRSTTGVATVVDPNNKARNQYLVCEGSRITCHPCPKGLVFDCRKGVCATDGQCPPIPEKCHCDCGINKKMNKVVTSETISTLTTVATTGVTVTSTTTSFSPVGFPSAAPSPISYVKEYTTKTTVVCTKTSIASGGQVEVPCGQLPSSTTSLKNGIPKTETKTVVTPSSNVTVTTTRDPCSETKTSTSSTCVGSCPATTTTVSVRPSFADGKWDSPVFIPSKWDSPVMTKQQCVCKMALKFSGASSAYACDPYAADRFLVCQADGVVVSEPCAAGTAWNYVEQTCSTMRKCRPVPVACAGL